MTQQDVTNGPNKFDLMASLFDGKIVWFTVEGMGKVKITVHGVNIDDASRERWLIEGYVFANGNQFYCHYDSRRRKGWLEDSEITSHDVKLSSE